MSEKKKRYVDTKHLSEMVGAFIRWKKRCDMRFFSGENERIAMQMTAVYS